MPHDFSTLTDAQLEALRDDTYGEIVALQEKQAAIHLERTARKKAAELAAKKAELAAVVKELEGA